MTKLLVIVAWGIPVLLLRGYVITSLWAWYLAPMGAPAMPLASGIGVSILASLLSPQKVDDDRFTVNDALRAVIGPMVALVVGFAWKAALG